MQYTLITARYIFHASLRTRAARKYVDVSSVKSVMQYVQIVVTNSVSVICEEWKRRGIFNMIRIPSIGFLWERKLGKFSSTNIQIILEIRGVVIQ